MKKVLMLSLILSMIAMMCSPYVAQAANAEEDKRAVLIDELVYEKMKAYQSGDLDLVESINEELSKLGAESMSTSDVLCKVYGDADAIPYFTLPISSDTEWTTARYT